MDTLADVLSSENVRLKKKQTKNNNAIIHSTNVPTKWEMSEVKCSLARV